MGSIGLRTPKRPLPLRQALARASHVKATGIYTHFADADHLDDGGGLCDYSQKQLEIVLQPEGRCDPAIPAHASNSAMSLVCPDANFSMIREGISLYGYPPVPTQPSLPPGAALGSRDRARERAYLPERSIGYGCTFTAEKPMRIATIAAGYGDGYHRTVSNRGQVLIHGRRARIVGECAWIRSWWTSTDIPEARKRAMSPC